MDPIFDWADEQPRRDAVVFQSSSSEIARLNYGDLRREVSDRAAVFSHLAPISRVGLIAAHGPEFLVEALAILHAGHCLVPIGAHLSENDRDELVDRAGLHALRIADQTGVVSCAGMPIDLNSDEDFRALHPAYLRFTSGSTGQRKGVLLSHNTLLERTAAANARLQISVRDCVLCLLPMVDHFVVSILLYLRYGATILLVENDVNAVEFAETQTATVLYGSPSQYRSFNHPLPNVRLAVSTTQVLAKPLADSFFERTGIPLTQALGIIEAGLLTLNEKYAAEEPLLAGEPMPDYQISISGKTGASGEIYVAGPGLLDAYVSPWRSRASIMTHLGFPTGDQGWINEAGVLHLTGRTKNRIELDSVFYFSEEIEAVINEHPLIEESLVFQRNDQLYVQIVAPEKAFLLPWIRDKTAFLKTPLNVERVDSLPRTPTGKLARPLS